MAGEPIRSYRDLIAWQRAIELAEAVYRLSTAFPRDELYGLTSQARRAAVSVAANIAEGYGRETRPAYISFLRISRASLRELETHLIIAQRVGLVAPAQVKPVLDLCEEEGRILHGLMTKLEADAQ
jgi:four helix bundle protein